VICDALQAAQAAERALWMVSPAPAGLVGLLAVASPLVQSRHRAAGREGMPAALLIPARVGAGEITRSDGRRDRSPGVC
jgi:hypothetical protein